MWIWKGRVVDHCYLAGRPFSFVGMYAGERLVPRYFWLCLDWYSRLCFGGGVCGRHIRVVHLGSTYFRG